ncbi:MAG TPA: lactate dehydrogenase [Candidatus Latescibacteria bacterium]|nr:lactate dehydrogenase [Candidatus Latescibacterota bacterium]
MPRIVYFTSQNPAVSRILLEYAPADFEIVVHPIDTDDEKKISLVGDADFLLLFPGRLSGAVLKAAKNVKLIQLVSAGFDELDLELCRKLGIQVANNGGTNAQDVAEHTVALILGVYRRLVDLDKFVRTNRWDELEIGLSTHTISGKTVGIIGLGHIGRQVARLLRGFGAYLIYNDVEEAQPELERELRISRLGLVELLQSSDIVTLHVPLTEQTRHLIGRRELSHMKTTALLINTCRGQVIDEQALTSILKENRIMGAGLDVLEEEPPDINHPLLSLENVLITPHVAGVTLDTWRRRSEIIYQNMQRVWEGNDPLSPLLTL